MATTVNMTIEQGTDFARVLTINDASGNPIDLTGYTFASQARLNYGDASAAFAFTLTPRTQTGSDLGKVDMTLADTVSAALSLTENTKYKYDVEMDNGSGTKYRLFQGEITMTPEVTKT